MAIKANIVIDQGADFTAEIQLLEDYPNDANDTYYDLTNHTLTGSMRKNYTSSTSVDFTCVLGDNPNLGIFYITLGNDVTSILEPGRYLYDVIVENPEGIKTRVVEGIATITPGMTRV